ncbi:MAG: SulP family inorganic anion transporter [Chloroflexi bacterium]|nr:SulP family inorganic anion transporter [Chloroflexota bacterium]
MFKLRDSYQLQDLLGDLFGGVTAAVVALPVALAFGVASGLGPIAGIYGAIAVGFFAAVFGGTPSQISGPTGPMTIAMAVVVTQHADSLPEAFTIVMLGGLLQIALGALRVGSFIAYTPYSVISGFMSGIGVIIIVIQTLPLLGALTVPGGPLNSIRAWPEAVADLNPDALALGAVALAVGVLWPRKLRKFLPGPLAALIVGTLLALAWFGDAPVIGAVPTGLPGLQLPEFSPGFLANALQPAFILALLGSIDSLLTSLVADSLTHTRHRPNRELMGQGLGNFVAGLIGALPGAGATMGTVVNIRAGGRTPLSGVLRSALLLALVLGIGQVTEPIPHAVLAGILLKVGWDIIDWRFLTRIRHIRRDYILVMITTLALTVFVDLVTAVALGLVAAGIAHSKEYERLELESVVSVPLLDQTFLPGREDAAAADPYLARVGLVALRGRFSVASAHELARVIGADIREHEVVIIDFSKATNMDDSAALVIEQLVETAAEEDTECIVVNLSGPAAKALHALNALKRVPEEHFVDTLDEARLLAKRLLRD